MNHTSILIHIVFSTKNRRYTLPFQQRPQLFSYISGIITNSKCKSLAVNGMGDHIHVFLDLTPSISVADMVKKIKQSSGNWLKRNHSLFPDFDGWQEGYFAGSVGPSGKENCIRYVNNQGEHHAGRAYLAEIEWINLKYEIEEQLGF